MDKALAVVDYLLNVPPQHMVFMIAVLAVSVVGYALHVVLAVLRSTDRKGRD